MNPICQKPSRLHFLMKATAFAILFALPLFSLRAKAQMAAATNSYLGVHAGELLPSQVQGVTETMAMWGIHYGIPLQYSWVEIGLMDANAMGTTWYDAHLSLKGNIPLQSIYAIMMIGADVHYYKGPTDSNYNMVAGGHVGTGIGAPITSNIHARAEMKFNINPGVTMYVGVGLDFQL